MEGLYRNGDGDVQPDVVTYNALMNAYGWSTCLKSKSSKCYGLYQRMIDLYESRTNRLAKPDIITCNSILNACAFEKVVTESERAAVMQVVAQTLEDFQSSSPTFGYPNYLTYSLVLLSISRHMPVGPRRTELSEATFWQVRSRGGVFRMLFVSICLVFSPQPPLLHPVGP